MNQKEQIIAKISSFPTLPVMVTKLLNVINDPEAGAADVAKIIQYDPALTANVLKAANSAYLGFRSPVNSISEASFRLGTKWIYQIAVSSLIFSNLKKPVAGYELGEEKLWKHSLSVALMAEALCTLLKIKDSGIIYTAALIHDMGKIVLGEFMASHMEKIQAIVDEKNIPFEMAEEEIMGIDHAELGALIAENWHFPDTIVNCIRWHHNPDAAPVVSEALDVVHIADSMSLMEGFGYGRDELQYRLSEQAAVRIKATTTTLELALSKTIIAMEDIENIFKDIPADKRGQEVIK